MINVARKQSVEIFIFAYKDNMYEAVLDYDKGIFIVRNEHNRPIVIWKDITRRQLDDVKKKISDMVL